MSAPATARARGHLRLTIFVAGLAGIALAVYLVLRSGIHDILHILDVAGWSLALLLPAHMAILAIDSTGWKALLGRRPRAGTLVLTWFAVIRDSVNGLLPVARVGGELVAVRLLMARGIAGSESGASVIVEVTITLILQFLFTLIGVFLLLYELHDIAAARAALIGLGVSLPALGVFFLLQHKWGLSQTIERVLVAVTNREVLALVGDPARLDHAVRELYANRRAIWSCLAWQLAALVAGAGEAWFTLFLLGRPIGFLGAILLESLGQALRSVSFIVPASLGIQEGGFLLFGAAIGLAPDMAIAFSLARRLRELGLGIPALLSWQWEEGRLLNRHLRWGRKKDEINGRSKGH